MKTLFGVILLNEVFYVRTQVFQILVAAGVDFFPLQSLDEALAPSFSRETLWSSSPRQNQRHVVGLLAAAELLHIAENPVQRLGNTAKKK